MQEAANVLPLIIGSGLFIVGIAILFVAFGLRFISLRKENFPRLSPKRINALTRLWGGSFALGNLLVLAGLCTVISLGFSDTVRLGEFFLYLLIIITFSAAAFAILIYAYSRNRCPNCGTWQTKIKTREEVIEHIPAFRTVTRQQKNADGRVISEWQEQINVLNERYLEHYTCPKCRAVWTEEHTRELENFAQHIKQ